MEWQWVPGGALVPGVLRVYFGVLSVVLIGYAAYGVLVNDLVIPGSRRVEASHLVYPASLVALVAVVCFCLALRAVIVDRCVLFRFHTGMRLRLSTYVLLIGSFIIFFLAMYLQFRMDVAALMQTGATVSGATFVLPSARQAVCRAVMFR